MTYISDAATVRIHTTRRGFSVYLRETFPNTPARRITKREAFHRSERGLAEVYATALADVNGCAVVYG